MVDIHSATAENRRGKRRRKNEIETTAAKYNGLPYWAAIKSVVRQHLGRCWGWCCIGLLHVNLFTWSRRVKRRHSNLWSLCIAGTTATRHALWIWINWWRFVTLFE